MTLREYLSRRNTRVSLFCAALIGAGWIFAFPSLPVCVTARIIMPTNRFHQFCILFGLSALLIGEALASTPVTPNLLVNGDAEAQRCTVDWTAQTSVPGWRVTRGAASVLCYAAVDYTGEAPVLPSSGSGGAALFTAPRGDTAMEQSVDVSAAASAIDHGTGGFTLLRWLA